LENEPASDRRAYDDRNREETDVFVMKGLSKENSYARPSRDSPMSVFLISVAEGSYKAFAALCISARRDARRTCTLSVQISRSVPYPAVA